MGHKKKEPKQPKKGKLWHRLFGHEPLYLAGYGPTALWFYCPCGGHVRIRVARDYVERLSAAG
jgi:hypothetical protein